MKMPPISEMMHALMNSAAKLQKCAQYTAHARACGHRYYSNLKFNKMESTRLQMKTEDSTKRARLDKRNQQDRERRKNETEEQKSKRLEKKKGERQS